MHTYHYGMLVISHQFCFRLAVLESFVPLVGRVLDIVVSSGLSFFPGAFVADPACVDVAVTKLVEEFTFNFFRFGFGVTVGT